MTDYDDLCKQLIAASHDERLSTGMLYREAADAIAALRAERDAAFAAGMRRAAEVCKNGGADWAYDLIITDLERLEE